MRCLCRRFNSQPPEGGWVNGHAIVKLVPRFQLTAARRRLGKAFRLGVILNPFQLTAARRRLGVVRQPLGW